MGMTSAARNAMQGVSLSEFGLTFDFAFLTLCFFPAVSNCSNGIESQCDLDLETCG